MAPPLGKILAQCVKDRDLYGDDDAYQAALEKDIGDMLGEFIKHMEDMDSLMEAWGTNCNNYGWHHWEDDDSLQPRVNQTVGDRITCKLMTTAILLMSKGSQSTLKDEGETENNKKMRQYMRCAIVNMFGTILTESACGRKWGIYYAWYSVDQMRGNGGMQDLIAAEDCRMGETDDIRRGQWTLSDHIKNWLRANDDLMSKIKGEEMTESCKKSAPASSTRKDADGQDDAASALREGESSALNTLKAGMHSILQRAQQEVVESANSSTSPVKDVQTIRPMTEPAAPKGPSAEKPTSILAPAHPADTQPATSGPAAEDNTSKKEDSNQGSAGLEATGAARAGSPQPQAPKGDTGAQAPGPVPQPPPPAPPPQETTSEGIQGGKDADQAGKCTESSTSTNKNGSGVTLSFACTPNSALGDPSSIPQNLPDPAPGPDPSEKTTSKDSKEPVSEQAPAAAAPAQPTDPGAGAETPPEQKVPETTEPPITGQPPTQDSTSAEPPAPGAHKPDNGPDGAAGALGSGTASNDAPPPLNPPKPKPNPNPNQSGSSGTGQPDAGGSSGTGSTGHQGPSSSGTGSTGGPGAGASHPSGGQGPRNNQVPPTLPSPTPFDPKDLIPYTPAIIPAVVGIGVIAFFLWKYFAYLAKGRRTFRTVRDVPSPPLDEEILQHLQRGDLPPPDYGYTLVRDRRPGRLPAARRRRQPRVHKRTIIELHLEVLHECEVAEWDTVQDDYLKILVEEFMGGNHGHSSSLDAPITNQALSRNNVASTLDPPTDSEQTDTCPPHDPDPWSCMETIQLATDPAASNEDDRWRCMETIQLATDPCAPNEHDPDPWSCMETIPLETHTSPPNEEGPDPWSRMENIQLATNPCAPNEHDTDPWSCMKTIQLATDRSPPNEDDRWRCMETIPLEMDPCAPNDPDPWSCMHTAPLEQAQHRPCDPRAAISTCTQWINWIDRNKHILRECTGQTWFNAFKSDWKQYYQQHATDEDNVVSGQRELGQHANIPSVEMQKLELWRQWIAQQHRQMSTYKEEEWFQHLLHTVEEEIESQTGEVPGVDKDLEVENVMAAEDVLRVRDLPLSQPLHQPPHMKKRVPAKLCMLLLASVIHECEFESGMHEKGYMWMLYCNSVNIRMTAHMHAN
ncbi:hypothetical protein AK88_05523 [Plasmodium fragile]|uniref:Schizont-infected cell agglutination C-terminal domain-containing protein n=1 Tax=Plasmodium fragile TaxID=5857 RepID=A0A0D9QCZ0_PLAFR|nr:uncharacterized protein AK88_05523 [Plasmodium fragile]KJP84844.1 hypothetical protein AK88_05523 [Plasmodium fragile]